MKNPVKKPSWWDEFAAFAIKGNAMALHLLSLPNDTFVQCP